MAQPSNRLDTFQKAIPNALLTAVFATLGLLWLIPIIGGKGIRIFWRLTFSQDIAAGWVGVFVLALSLAVTWGIGRWSGLRQISLETAASFTTHHIKSIALASLPIYCALALFVSHRHPFAADEFSVLLQSQIFATGHIAGRLPPELTDSIVPPIAQGFSVFVSHLHGTLVSSYWPGFALLLTPFTLLGVPWLCNPVLTSLSIWLLHRVTYRMTDSLQAAFWATIFALSSSVIALSTATYFSMPAHLLFSLVFCWLLLQQTRRAAFLAGVVGSFALILHNPLPHALFALPWLIWVARKRRDLLGPLLLGYLVFAPVIGFGWRSYLKTFDAGPILSLSKATIGAASGTLLDTLAQVFVLPRRDLWLTRFAGLSKMLIWATPGLGVLAWISATRVKEPFLRLLAWSFVSVFAGYLFIRYDQGAGWGFRYIHSAWMALPILAGSCLTMAPAQCALGGLPLRRYFAVVSLLSVLILLPFQCWQVERFISFQTAQVPAAPNVPSLTFINLNSGYYTVELVRNDPFMRNLNWKLVSYGAASNKKWARRILRAPRCLQTGNWGEIWVGDAFTPRYARWRSGAR